MGDTVREHEYINGACQICGDREANNVNKDRSCIARAAPRSIPKSVFAEIDPIYNRIQELERERRARLAATTALD